MKEKIKDNVVPEGKWEFDEKVTDCFEDMLSRSIPQYDLMRESSANLVYDVIKNPKCKKDTFNILDIGCSDGLMIEKLISKFNDEGYGYYTGVDISEPMLDKARCRLSDKINKGNVKIENCDLRTDFPYGHYDAITSILSIQFTPIEYRQHIIQEIYNNLSNVNGCFIMVEKVLGNTDNINKLFVKNYYDMKKQNGYTEEQIERKRLSLEGVLVPVTSDWNIDLLKQAGFRQIDVFWKWMNFVGYIAFK
jgi:tRNA (cmo5U34)-methyltransferase